MLDVEMTDVATNVNRFSYKVASPKGERRDGATNNHQASETLNKP